tara:strand:+ start:4438 stop:4818 length:381 start_codon:yes stop_codon:yes gene_type:complete
MSISSIGFSLLYISILMVAIDSVFLFSIRSFFSKQIMDVQGEPLKVNYYSAFLCYLLLVFALYHFIIAPRRSLFDAFLLGFIIYGVYETTTKALLKKWNWITVFVDTLWGGILFALTAYLTYKMVV